MRDKAERLRNTSLAQARIDRAIRLRYRVAHEKDLARLSDTELLLRRHHKRDQTAVPKLPSSSAEGNCKLCSSKYSIRP